MKFKIKILVKRKMKRWSQGKGPLSKEQLDFIDKMFLQEYYTRR